MLTLHQDGTLLFSSPDPDAEGAGHGVWVRTGANNAAAFALLWDILRADESLEAVDRLRISMRFGEDFDHLRGEISGEVFDCVTDMNEAIDCDDPFGSDFFETFGPIPFQGRRMRVR